MAEMIFVADVEYLAAGKRCMANHQLLCAKPFHTQFTPAAGAARFVPSRESRNFIRQFMRPEKASANLAMQMI